MHPQAPHLHLLNASRNMHPRPTLSAILITRNEVHNIRECLASLEGWVDEIVVVDHASTDSTAAIAQEFGARVIQTEDWPGFGPQKNRALNAATSEWVLSLDADERVTPALAKEIRLAMESAQFWAYTLPRLSWYCGRFMRHGGWYPDRVLRLFKRGEAIFSNALVHEIVQTAHPVGALQNDLIHYSYRDFSQVLRKTDQYSTAGATQAFQNGKRAGFASALGHGLWAFVRTYILRRGFLDGAHGLALAISNAEASYYKYLKLWQLGNDEARARIDHQAQGSKEQN